MYIVIGTFLFVCCVAVFIVNVLKPNKATQMRDIPYIKLILPLLLSVLLFFFSKGMLPSIKGRLIHCLSLLGIITYTIIIIYKKFRCR